MKRRAIVYFLGGMVCMTIVIAISAFGEVNRIRWKHISGGIGDSEYTHIVVDPSDPQTVYITSPHALYKTHDRGKSWREVLSFRSTGKMLHSVAVASVGDQMVYAGASDGLYFSRDKGVTWKKIFNGIGEREGTILSVAVDAENSDEVYIGTASGIFRTEDAGRKWEKMRNLPTEILVSSLVIDRANPHMIFAVTDRGLFRSRDKGNEWINIYKTVYRNQTDDLKEDPDMIDDVERSNVNEVKAVALNPAKSGEIYIGTSRGLFMSRDAGTTWEGASSVGLTSRDIRHLVPEPNTMKRIYAATNDGVFCYSISTDTWDELYHGLVSPDTRYLAISSVKERELFDIWAVTKKGVYIASSLSAASHPYADQNDLIPVENLHSLFSHEPTIDEIRNAAIRYAEVQPEKIENWRKAAARRAWLPDLRLSYDENSDWQSSTYFYSTSSQKYKDDDITEGKDDGWSISLLWQLGDLIWNDAQTSIDSRSRLMVQLRDDILNEVTRLYYERRRLQIEIAMSSHDDVYQTLEKDLRLQELTAHIDALTGSYLSKRLVP